MEDFNQPSPERVDLLKRLQEKVIGGKVPPHFWAACQICDLGALAKISDVGTPYIVGVIYQTSQMIRHWGSSPGYQSLAATPKTSTPKTPTPQKSAASNSAPSPSTSSPPAKRRRTLESPTTLPRDANAKKRAEERDNFRCVLTGIKIIEVAHIYPHHSMKQMGEDGINLRREFWNHLKLFWPEEKVTAWEAKLFPHGVGEKGREEVYNLISLAPTVHAIWGQGKFALKPISEAEDKKTLTVQFFWQENQNAPFPQMSLTTTPISTQGLQQTAGVWLFDKNGKQIQTGDCFELHTDDPIQKPLPNFELLELQWFLHRIQGMAGAVDVGWENWQYPDSDRNSVYSHDLPYMHGLARAADVESYYFRYTDSDRDSVCSNEDIPDLTLEEPSFMSIEPLPSPINLEHNDIHSKHRTEKIERDGEGAGEGAGEGRDRRQVAM